jgi:hypothetical protein
MTERSTDEYLIKIEGHDSSYKPRGFEGFFPVNYIQFTDTFPMMDDYSREAVSKLELPRFTPESSHSNKEGVKAFADLLIKLSSEKKLYKVTLLKVKNESYKKDEQDLKTWKKDVEQECPDATILKSMHYGGYVVKSKTGVVGTGEDALTKTSIDFENQIIT